MDTNWTLETLRNYFVESFASKNEVSKEDYKYVIYARKSTDDKDKQSCSLSDQVKECKKYAASVGLVVVGKPIEEKKSAKKSGQRPKFDEILNMISTGKIHGIISWHPDRLSRNMKEAGIIIEMLDEGKIKDLRFVTQQFDNSASGKMMLAISFAISKQYSDNMSVNITRGSKNRLYEGHGMYPVHGYYKDGDNFLRPDGANHDLLREAFQMRLGGETHAAICEFLNTSGYQKARGMGVVKHITFKWTPGKLSEQFSNPIFAGLQLHGKDVVNLVDLYNFEPLITPEQYVMISSLGKNQGFLKKHRSKKKKIAQLLNGKILCGYCKRPMHASMTTKKPKNGQTEKSLYLFYRCPYGDCPFFAEWEKFKAKKRHHLHVKARVIVNFAQEQLTHLKVNSEETFNSQIAGLKAEAASNIQKLQVKKTNLERQRVSKKDHILSLQEAVKNIDTKVVSEFQSDLDNEIKSLTQIKFAIAEVEEAIEISQTAVPTYKDFLELIASLPVKLQYAKMLLAKDRILSSIFSNFYVTDKGVQGFTLAEPYASLLVPQNVRSRSGGTIRTCA